MINDMGQKRKQISVAVTDYPVRNVHSSGNKQTRAVISGSTSIYISIR